MFENLIEKFVSFFASMRNWPAELRSAGQKFRELTRTTTFRVALGFAGLFSGFAIILLTFIWGTTVGLLDYEASKAVKSELNVLLKAWEQDGIDAVNMEIIERSTRTTDNLYVLITPSGQFMSGNINAIPLDLSNVERPQNNESVWEVPLLKADFTYYRDAQNSEKRQAKGVFIALPDGYGLFVARDLGTGYVFAGRVVKVVWFGSIAVLIFSILGGYIAARWVASRIDELSKTTEAVMAGNLSKRAPVRNVLENSGDEFDKLANDLNAMLDRTERLVQSSRTIGDAVAHDLRSPLTRLRANLETASFDAKSEDDLRIAIEETISGLDNVVGTFNAVLRLSKLESGQGAVKEYFNLSDVLGEICELFEPSITEKGLEFTFQIPQDLQINADKSLLIQALANIFDNAIKYTQNGKIELFASKKNGKIKIELKDSGLGIASENRGKVFERFFRLERERSTIGNGIGLSLVLAIMDAHSGKIELTDGLVNQTGGVGLSVALIFP